MKYRRLRIPGGTYFFTLVTFDRRPIFADGPTVHLFLSSIEHVRTKYPFEMPAWVILPEHVHAMWVLPENDTDFALRWGLIKSRFSRQFAQLWETPAPSDSRLRNRERGVWQSRFWEHYIHSDDDYNRHLDYIHFNPVMHGHVRDTGAWPHSSFQEYVAQGVYAADWQIDALLTAPPMAEME